MQMEGINLVETPSHRIVELGIAHVPENRRLFPRMTVEGNLRMRGFIPQAIHVPLFLGCPFAEALETPRDSLLFGTLVLYLR